MEIEVKLSKKVKLQSGSQSFTKVEPTLRREIVHWHFSPPLLISQATSHAPQQLLKISAVTATVTYMTNFEKTLTFFELKEMSLFGNVSFQGTRFEIMLWSPVFYQFHQNAHFCWYFWAPKEDRTKSLPSRGQFLFIHRCLPNIKWMWLHSLPMPRGWVMILRFTSTGWGQDIDTDSFFFPRCAQNKSALPQLHSRESF